MKQIVFIGQALEELRDMPDAVRRTFGSELRAVQTGKRPEGAYRFGEGLPAAITKLSKSFGGDTYRAAYTVQFPELVYVLAVFQKKSTHGIGTPKRDRERVLSRYRAAVEHYQANFDPTYRFRR